MDDNAKHASSYQVDQEILEARGINMTVEEVAGLTTCKYSERVQSMKLTDEDRAFLKGLRRRIKNRLASQNSRRRSVEHLRKLTRELRAVRACRNDALADRRALQERRDTVRDKCATLRRHLLQILQARSDTTEVPSIEVVLPPLPPKENHIKNGAAARTKSPLSHISEYLKKNDLTEKIKKEIEIEDDDVYERVRQELQREREQFEREKHAQIEDMSLKRKLNDFDKNMDSSILNFSIKKELDTNIFECKIGKLVQQSVNHIFNDKKKVVAKTVFIANEKMTSNVKSLTINSGRDEVLNLCVKEGRRKSHGRKQSAPRRIACCALNEDGVLDLKIKKESQ